MTKYVIISGAYGSLGKALASQFGKAGFGLILMGRKLESLEHIKQEMSEITKVKTYQVDVRNLASCKVAYDQICKEKLSVKVLVNNAGITYIKLFDKDFDIWQFDQVVDTNLKGPVYLTYLFREELIKNNGSLINISSVLGFVPMLGRTAYVASKFGLDGFSQVLKAELDKKIHLMMVYPTFFESGIRKEEDRDKTVKEVLSAESVAIQIFSAFERRKDKVYIGKTSKLCLYINKFWPKLYVHLMRRKVGKLE